MAIDDLVPLTNGLTVTACGNTLVCDRARIRTVKGDAIDCGTGPIKVLAIRDPAQLPWKELGVDVALECTGLFASKEKASAHLKAGAKRVLTL